MKSLLTLKNKGMKFALIEMKIALVNILRTYEIHPSKNTPKSLRTIEGIVRQPRDGIPVIFKKINKKSN